MSNFTNEEIDAGAQLEQALDVWRAGDRALVVAGRCAGREVYAAPTQPSRRDIVQVVYADSGLGTWLYASDLVRLPPNPKET